MTPILGNARLMCGESFVHLQSHPQGLLAVMEAKQSFQIVLSVEPETTVVCSVGGISVKTGQPINWETDLGYRVREDGKLVLQGFEDWKPPVLKKTKPEPDLHHMSDRQLKSLGRRTAVYLRSQEYAQFQRRLTGMEPTPSESQGEIHRPFLTSHKKTEHLQIDVRCFSPKDGRHSKVVPHRLPGVIGGCSNADIDSMRRARARAFMREWERANIPEVTYIFLCVPRSQLRRYGIVLPVNTIL